MTSMADYALRVAREGLYLMLLLSAPVLLVSIVVGLVVSILQAATQVQDATISTVPKLVAAFVTLAVVGPWMGSLLLRFAQTMFEAFPLVVR